MMWNRSRNWHEKTYILPLALRCLWQILQTENYNQHLISLPSSINIIVNNECSQSREQKQWAGLCIFSVPPVATAVHSQSARVRSQTNSSSLVPIHAESMRFGGKMASSKRGSVSLGMTGFCMLACLKAQLCSPSLFSRFLERFLLVFCMWFPWPMSLLPASLFLVLCLILLLTPLSTLSLCTYLLI